ncbi:MAG TPA: hypothetical protein VE053_06655 [Allosphingosinicella sp.]|nr:hypothetical protein [Allosphingosinicella sp.]
MTETGVPMKEYLDALNAERRHTADMRSVAIVGTLGAMIFGIFRATGVLAETFEKRMQTTNEWRGALEDQAKGKATVQQVEQIERTLDEVRRDVAAEKNKTTGSTGNWKTIGAIVAAIAAINGIIFVIQGAGG